MTRLLTIDEAIDEVTQAAYDRLVAAMAPGSLLEDAAEVVRGDRKRGTPKLPGIWLIPDGATIDHTTQGLGEQWALILIVAALLKNDDDPEQGYRDATTLAGKAMQALLGRDRNWGLDTIRDVLPIRFDPSSPRNSSEKRALFWADGVVQVRFRRLEP